MAKIYTRSGDKGETSLYTGERVPKHNPFIEAIGAVDECNSAIGAVIACLPQDHKKLHVLTEQLTTIQHSLFDVGAALATPRSKASALKEEKTRFDQHATDLLEKWMDAMDEQLAPLNHFILPGGHEAGALLHLARAICRRAERRVAPLYDHADVSDRLLIYLNRLSDYLFIASRYVNKQLNKPETAWQIHKTSHEQT